jgi:Mn-dependent DtxR family transcriptional regulator
MSDFLEKFPPSVEKVVDKLEAEMTFADRTRLANMNEAGLVRFHQSYGLFLRTEFRLPGNDPLMRSCLSKSYLKTITPEQASFVILKELQKRLLSGNALKVIK